METFEQLIKKYENYVGRKLKPIELRVLEEAWKKVKGENDECIKQRG